MIKTFLVKTEDHKKMANSPVGSYLQGKFISTVPWVLKALTRACPYFPDLSVAVQIRTADTDWTHLHTTVHCSCSCAVDILTLFWCRDTRNKWTTAGEVDKIEQTLGNVPTNATKHKETIVHNAFDKNVLLRVQEDRQQKKKEAKKRTDKKELM